MEINFTIIIEIKSGYHCFAIMDENAFIRFKQAQNYEQFMFINETIFVSIKHIKCLLQFFQTWFILFKHTSYNFITCPNFFIIIIIIIFFPPKKL
uniref:Uncharacterized protein n=1 Tax=Cucumis melo TaxID=3656 RepID=A0A9I9EAB4_CUCME